MSGDDGRTIRSAERTFDIIELVRTLDGATLSTVAEELDVAPSTAHQYLTTLANREYLVREGDEYRLSLRFLELGAYARDRRAVHRSAEEKVIELAEMTDERAQYVVPEHNQGVVLFTAVGSHAVRTDITIGTHVPLHATAAGKAMLAYLPDERVAEVVEACGLDAVTDHTITDRQVLFDELAEIRERNVAYNNQEDTERLHAVGVPVRDPDGGVLGSLSVSGPTHRLKGEVFNDEIPDLLLGTANELELIIEYQE